MTRSVKIESGSPSSFLPSGTIRFSGRGTQTLEVLSNDLGNISSGFSPSNYLFGTIEALSGAYVQLLDKVKNSTGNGPESIYANAVIVRSGSTLDLGGYHLYARSQQVENGGKIVNGIITILLDQGPLTLGIPTPGKIDLVGNVDTWTFFARAGGSVSVKLNPGSTELPSPVSP